MAEQKDQIGGIEGLIDSLTQPVLIFEGLHLSRCNQSARELLALPDGPLPELTAEEIFLPCPQLPPNGRPVSFSSRLLKSATTGTMVQGHITTLEEDRSAWVMERGGALADLGALTAGWIHNLAGPLSVVRSTAELMDHIFKRQAGTNPDFALWMQNLPETARKGLTTIIDSVDQCSKSAGDLMARIQGEAVHTVQDLDINQILQSELEFMRGDRYFKYDIELQTYLDPNLPIIKGIYADFSQSLRNVLLNAAEAMMEAEEKRLTVTTKLENGQINILIADTGSGVAEDIKLTLFEPFITTKDISRGASGLGLHTARQLLKPYRTVFGFDSVPGRTVFSITIPLQSNS